MCLVNYELAEEIHNKSAKVKKHSDKIKEEVKEIEGKSKLTGENLTEQGAFMKWLDEMGIKEKYLAEYKKLKKSEKMTKEIMVMEELLEYTPDIIEIFGETGSNKTSFAIELAKNKAMNGKKTLYIDTERNITNAAKEQMQKLGVDYKYIPEFNKLVNYIKELKTKYDWLIIDSIGLPALGEFVLNKNQHSRGNVLQNVQAILYALKIYTAEYDCYALVVNQPTSEMNKIETIHYKSPSGKTIKMIKTEPFGDKGSFFVKEILRTVVVSKQPNKTECDIFAWRSRCHPFGKGLIKLTKTGKTAIEIKPY